MWLTVEHVTRFSYDGPASEAYTEVRLKPQHRDGQRCSSFTLRTEPAGASVHEYRDSFGNAVHHFDVLEPHTELVLTARSEVWTMGGFAPDDPEPTVLDRWDLVRESPYVPLEGPVAELAATVPRAGATTAAAYELMAAVRGRLTYERGSTTVSTRADEAIAAGRGVCQDFAHAFVGVCRVHGIPARYVSGYLHDTRTDDHASHAWVDVLVDEGWLSLDPTHGRPQDEHYVRVAAGRDYADVPPTRGVFKGGGAEVLAVDVRVRAL